MAAYAIPWGSNLFTRAQFNLLWIAFHWMNKHEIKMRRDLPSMGRESGVVELKIVLRRMKKPCKVARPLIFLWYSPLGLLARRWVDEI